MTITDLYKECAKILAQSNIENSEFESACLIEKVFGYDRTRLITYGSNEADSQKAELMKSLTARRALNEPLQYILGSWSFMGFKLNVGEGVLIPRDDTEVVVRLCIDFLRNRPSKKAIDLCSGSGAVAIALNKITMADMTAVELSDAAFEYLQANIRLNYSTTRAVKGDIFDCYKSFPDRSVDLIVSNPPYIISDDIDTLQAEVQREPRLALDGGKDGYDFYRAITKNWSSKLVKGGAMAFELGEGQADTVKQLMSDCGFGNFIISDDLGNIHRAIIGTLL